MDTVYQVLIFAAWVVTAMIITGERTRMTLPVGLSTMITPYGNNYDMLMPGAVLAVIPIAVIYLFKQKPLLTA
jgi:arabinosaccharide transport system permease protein